jgi:putative oxidoreductase
MDQPVKPRGVLYTVSRVLLGLLFVVMGLNGFLLFMPPPPPSAMPAVVVQWNTAMFMTHYVWMTSGFQLLAGILLLLNRYVLVALIILAAILVNILTFHITMWPQTLFPLPILAVILWLLTCWPLRDRFAPLFASKV